MLETTSLVLFVLWILAFVGGFAFGGSIHVLLAVALLLGAIQFLRQRRQV